MTIGREERNYSCPGHVMFLLGHKVKYISRKLLFAEYVSWIPLVFLLSASQLA